MAKVPVGSPLVLPPSQTSAQHPVPKPGEPVVQPEPPPAEDKSTVKKKA